MTILTFQPDGYCLNFSPKPADKSSLEKNQFCGENRLMGGLCANCSKPLLLFARLSPEIFSADSSFDAISQINLVYCWTCAIAEETFFYKICGPDSIEIVQYKKGKLVEGFPYVDYPEYFPEGVLKSSRIHYDVQSLIQDINSGEKDEIDVEKKYEETLKPSHQIGGEPYLIDGKLEKIYCPECGMLMPFFASIGDDCLDPRGFTGNDYVQVIFLICISCCILGAYQRCD